MPALCTYQSSSSTLTPTRRRAGHALAGAWSSRRSTTSGTARARSAAARSSSSARSRTRASPLAGEGSRQAERWLTHSTSLPSTFRAALSIRAMLNDLEIDTDGIFISVEGRCASSFTSLLCPHRHTGLTTPGSAHCSRHIPAAPAARAHHPSPALAGACHRRAAGRIISRDAQHAVLGQALQAAR